MLKDGPVNGSSTTISELVSGSCTDCSRFPDPTTRPRNACALPLRWQRSDFAAAFLPTPDAWQLTFASRLAAVRGCGCRSQGRELGPQVCQDRDEGLLPVGGQLLVETRASRRRAEARPHV